MSSRELGNPTGFAAAVESLRANKEQWSAYNSTGNCVVLAGPGSGKTKVLTAKVARMLVEDVQAPRGVACITYSSECARELERRFRSVGVQGTSNLFVGTVHSFCLKCIVQPYAQLANEPLPHPLRVATEAEVDRCLSDALKRLVGDERLSSWKIRVDSYRRTILDRDSPDWRDRDSQAAAVIEAYEAQLHSQGMIDFDDMMLFGLRLIERHEWVRRAIHARFPILVVDEYQDLGVPLHRLVNSMCLGKSRCSRLFAVGDPDQSIYGFTGAQPELLEQLASDDRVEPIRLKLNYRSRQQIITGSEAALGQQRGYQAANAGDGVVDFHPCLGGIQGQAKAICEMIPKVLAAGVARGLGEIAVLYLDKNIGDQIAVAATNSGFDTVRIDRNAPYQKGPFTRWLEGCAAWCCGGWRSADVRLSDLISSWKGFWIAANEGADLIHEQRALVKFLFAHRDPSCNLASWLQAFDAACLKQIAVLAPSFAPDMVSFQKIQAACSPGKAMATWSVAQFAGQLSGGDHLKLITLHSSKGLEFDVVFMLGMDQGVLPWKNRTEKKKREPRRLFYVGLTRARHEVHLMFTKDQHSEFVVDVHRSLNPVPKS